MYYRRKILLALLETFGGHLKRTYFQKLLFLYCQYTNKNHYDFFPYKYGCYSFLATQDKSVLEKYGYLKKDDDLILDHDSQLTEELNDFDRKKLKSFYSDFRNLKGKSLIKYTYLEFPEYSKRSTILPKVLDPDEQENVKKWWNNDESECLYSIGYEGESIDSYLKKLILNNIKALIDVRKNPVSMKYGFSKKRFQYYLENAGIKYIHIPQLGIPSDLRKNLNNPEDYRSLFLLYESDILPFRNSELHELRIVLEKYNRVALTCFEKDYKFCHRHKITDYLKSNSENRFPVIHL